MNGDTALNERNELNDEFDFAKNVIVCENLVKIYKTKDIEVLALKGWNC